MISKIFVKDYVASYRHNYSTLTRTFYSDYLCFVLHVRWPLHGPKLQAELGPNPTKKRKYCPELI